MRCAVLVGILAVIAGILGMHVMTGSHASHSGAAHPGVSHAVVPHEVVPHTASGLGAAAQAAAGHPMAADDGDGKPGGTAHPGGGAAVVLSAGALCGEACPGVEEAGAECVPSANAGSFRVVSPPATAIQQEARGAAAAAATCSYVPSGPTPCELSISRT